MRLCRLFPVFGFVSVKPVRRIDAGGFPIILVTTHNHTRHQTGVI